MLKFLARELGVQEPPDVANNCFVKVQVAQFLAQPLGAVMVAAHPTHKSCLGQRAGKRYMQPVVWGCHHVARFIVHNCAGQIAPTMLGLHLRQNLWEDMAHEFCQVACI